MKFLLKIVLGLVVVAAALLVGGFFVLKRDDIPYAQLEANYATSDSKFIDLPSGVHMHYRDRGNRDGRTLVLIHGYGENLETWEQWVKLLSPDFRVISLDLPGHGLTRVPDAYPPKLPAFVDTVDEFATATGLQKFALAGNSMGGNVAWLYAIKYPTKLAALILVDAGGWPTQAMLEGNAEDQPWVFRLIANPHIAPLLAKLDPQPLMRNGLKLAYANDALATDEIVTRYSDFACAPGHRQFIGSIERGMTSEVFASAEKLSVIHVPTLILWGAKDELISVGNASRFAEAIHDSTMLVYPESGHVPQEEASAKSAEDVKTFLKMIPATVSGP